MTLALNTKNIKLFVIATVVSLLGMVFFAYKSVNAGPCYIETGPFQVSADTHTCPQPDAQGRTAYVDPNGNAIAGAPLASDCYVRSTSGSGSFATIRYTRQNCSDLEALRNVAVNNAGGSSTGEPTYVKNDCEGENLDKNNCGIIKYLVLFINVLSGAVGLVVVGSIIYGGIQYSSAGSDPAKISAAKNRIRDSIMALLFFLFAYSILNWLVPGGVL